MGPERDAALQRFRDAPQVPLPPLRSELTSVPSGTAAGLPSDAQSAVKQGRDATRSGDYPGAIAAFDAAIAADDSLATAWSGRGFARLQQGQLDLAKSDFERALALDDTPNSAAAVRFNLGTVAERQGDTKAAKAAYEASLALRDVAAVREALARVAGETP
ncbi:MAG: tetratricopeptide repeat protein [Nannocystaceae bacterium]